MNREVVDSAFLKSIETAMLYYENPMNGYFGGSRKSDAYGNTVEFADFREYVPGDDIRRIDWKIYGRFEKYIIKLFVDERRLNTQVFLDCSASMDWGEPDKATAALRIAAAFGYLSVLAMDRVSYFMLKDKKCIDLCGEFSGRDAFYAAADKLSRIEFEGDTDFEAAIKSCPNPGYGDGLSVIISDFFTDSNWKAAVDYLVYLKRRVLVVQLLSPEEMDPEYGGRLQLIDSESESGDDYRNTRIDIGRKAVKVYKKTLEKYEEDIVSFCNSRNVEFLCISSVDQVEKVLFRKGIIR